MGAGSPQSTDAALAPEILSAWESKVQQWSQDGSLLGAAQEALMLPGEPQALKDLIAQWSAGDFEGIPEIVLLSGADMNGALGAYALSTGKIYLNEDWLKTASQEVIDAVLTEELGHHLDGLLNVVDTHGDEGEYFTKLLIQRQLSETEKTAIINQSDPGLITVQGVMINAEKAANTIIRGNSLYTTVNGPSWTLAEANSVALGGHLAAISSKSENDYLFSTFGPTPNPNLELWIGLNDAQTEGVWQWSNGEAVTYTNWTPGVAPANTSGIVYGPGLGSETQDYVNFWWGTNNGTWDDYYDNDNVYSRSGIAEIPLSLSITRQGVVKEGGGLFTTSINLSAGTLASGNLADGSQVWWQVTGITADDLVSGALTGNGFITNGKLDIQHSLKVDPDTGESFEVSVFTDSLLTQQIGSQSRQVVNESIRQIRGNSLYTTVNGPSWTLAEANSVALGGHLAAISSKSENDYLFSTFGPTPNPNLELWIGLNDAQTEGVWQWSNGEAVTYTNWTPGVAPANTSGIVYGPGLGSETQDYVNFWWGTNNGTWDDYYDNDNVYSRSGIAEIPLSLSITRQGVVKEGGGLFTTSINLSAGTLASGNLADGSQVWWQVTGITADDLVSGALTGNGFITNGKLDIQHSLKVDPDTGESFEVSVFSDAGMTQQIGTTNSILVAELGATYPIYTQTVYNSSTLVVTLVLSSGVLDTGIDWGYLRGRFSVTSGATLANGGTIINDAIGAFGSNPNIPNSLDVYLYSAPMSKITSDQVLYINYTDLSPQDDTGGVLQSPSGSDSPSFSLPFSYVYKATRDTPPTYTQVSYDVGQASVILTLTSGVLNTFVDWGALRGSFHLTTGASFQDGGTVIANVIQYFGYDPGKPAELVVYLSPDVINSIAGDQVLYINYQDPTTGDDGSGVLQAIDGTDASSFSFSFRTGPNSNPTDITSSSTNFNENIAANTSIATFSTTDPDVGNAFTYSLVPGTGSTDNNAFTISGSQLLISASPNFESKSTYSVRVRSTDQGGLSFEKSFDLSVANLQEGVGVVNPISAQGAAPFYVGVTLAAGAVTGDPDGNGTVTGYQWYQNEISITGATSSSYNTSSAGTGSYKVAVNYIDGQGQSDTIFSTVQSVTLPPDTTPPEISSITLKDSTILLKFTEEVTADLTPTSAFTVATVDPVTGVQVNQTVTLIAQDASDKTQLILLISGGITDLNFRVTYTDPSGNQVISVVQDLAGNDLATVTRDADNMILTGFVNTSATGNSLNNIITGNDGANSIAGGNGNDLLIGGAGADILYGGNGNDNVDGGTGNDLIVGGDGAGDDIYNGGDGIDTVKYTSATLGIIADLSKGTASGSEIGTDTLSNIENVIGGQNSDTIIGSSDNNVLDGWTGADTLRGGLGDDIYIVDNIGDVVTENLNEGTDTIQSSITYTLGINLENLTLTGTAANNGTGNTLNNVITGNSGNNTLDGGAGADTLVGGAGDDTYIIGAGDTVTENLNEGTDTVQSSITYTLGANLENLTLTGTTAINGTGNTLNNVITGNSGNNILDGGTGTDTLIGGAGNDTYVVDNAGDVVTEAANAGTDTVQSSITYTLGANLENLTLTGTAAINGTGNALNNVITGNSGNNTLDGGAGADTLVGGAGDDTYVIGAGDTVTENLNAGTDTVQSSVTYTLGANVENLTLTGTTAINGTGNTLNNVITGNTGNNTLNGGTGTDTLIGGGGNDTYVVDNAGDVVTEAANAGTDTVQSSITYTLGANLENLTLTGTAAINGTGNTLNNTITGNSGNNTLDGGTGADTLVGGAGNDTYVIDNAGDVVTEAANAGTDAVQSSITYTLGTNVENLTLTGTTAINGTGNTLNNTLTGNAAANILIGGAGADTLIGGGGADTFRFALADSRLASLDRITDFAIGTDILDGPTVVTAANTKELGTVATLNQAGISAVLTTAVFGANQAATFTFGTGATARTFLALNDATAGFSSTSDGLIEITGCTGLLTNLAIA